MAIGYFAELVVGQLPCRKQVVSSVKRHLFAMELTMVLLPVFGLIDSVVKLSCVKLSYIYLYLY